MCVYISLHKIIPLSPELHTEKPGIKRGKLKISHMLKTSASYYVKSPLGTEHDHELLLLCETPAKWWSSHANNPKPRQF